MSRRRVLRLVLVGVASAAAVAILSVVTGALGSQPRPISRVTFAVLSQGPTPAGKLPSGYDPRHMGMSPVLVATFPHDRLWVARKQHEVICLIEDVDGALGEGCGPRHEVADIGLGVFAPRWHSTRCVRYTELVSDGVARVTFVSSAGSRISVRVVDNYASVCAKHLRQVTFINGDGRRVIADL